MIIVVAIIWVLMMWMTVYMWWYNERTKIIEAQWCAATLWWEMDNYVFYALTSKKLKIGDELISPSSYHIYLTWWRTPGSINCYNYTWDARNPNRWDFCDEIVLSYYTWWDSANTMAATNTYKILNPWANCRQNNWTKLIYYRWDSIKLISMNKWFSPSNYNDKNPFRLNHVWDHSNILYWEIIIVACISWDDDCTWRKEVAKRIIDARSQSISLKNCKFYNETNPSLCETWEDEDNEEA